MYLSCPILYTNNNIANSMFLLYIVYWSLCILCVGSVRVKVFNYVNYNGSISVTMTSLYENEVVVFSSIDFMQSSSYEKLFIRSDNGMYSILHISYVIVGCTHIKNTLIVEHVYNSNSTLCNQSRLKY